MRAWLDRTELAPPGALGIDLEVSTDVPPPPHTVPALEQPEISIHRVPGGGVTILWQTAPAVVELPAGSSRARMLLSPAAADDLERCLHFLGSMMLVFLLRRAGWQHLHAVSAVDPLGRGWLLAGDGSAGKSTTAALLASQGWAVGNDDMVYLHRVDDRVVADARRAPIALRSGGRALLGRLGGSFDARRDKTLFTPEELGGRWAPRVRPDILVFLSIGEGGTTMQPIRASEVLSQLVRWSAWVIVEPELAQEHLDVLADLGRQTRAYRASLGPDLFGRPARLLDLVS